MKKKLLIALLALTSATACALGIAACNNGGGENKGDTKPEESVFSNAIETAFAGSYTMTYEDELFVSTRPTHRLEADVVNNRYLITQDSNTPSSVATKSLFTKEGDKYLYYITDSTYWAQALYTQNGFEKIAATRGAETLIGTVKGGDKAGEFINIVLTDKYESYKYNKTTETYTLTNLTLDSIGSAEKVSVKFNGSKLDGIEIDGFKKAGWDDSMKMDIAYSKFGTTAVAMPDDADVRFLKPSENEWKAGLDAFAAAKNLSLTMTVGNNTVGAMKLNGDTYYDIVGTSERVFGKNGTAYFKLYRNSSSAVWKKENITAADYDNAVNKNACNLITGAADYLRNKYSSFKYTYEENTFTADDEVTGNGFTVTDGFNISQVNIIVRRGKIVGVSCVWNGKNVVINDIGSTNVTIPQTVPVTEIQLNKTELTLKPNRSSLFDLTVKLLPENSSCELPLISSDNEEVATAELNKIGSTTYIEITSHQAGVATINVTADGITQTCKVTVIPKEVDGQTFALKSADVYNPYQSTITGGNVWQTLSLVRGACTNQEKQIYANYGKTITFGADDKITGTCDFGDGALGTLTGDKAYTVTEVESGFVSYGYGFKLAGQQAKITSLYGKYNAETGELMLVVRAKDGNNQTKEIRLIFEWQPTK